MYTRWHMTIFLFMGCIGIGLLLYSALNLIKGGGTRRPLPTIGAAVFSCAAIAAVAMSLNEPSKLVHILAKPTSGLSSALIGQIAVIVAAMFLYFKSDANKRLLIVIGVFIAAVSAVSLGRVYMIPSRPAIDTFLMYILLLLIVAQAAGYFAACKETGKRYHQIMLLLAAVYAVGLLAFLFRLKFLVPEDRLFTFASLSLGTLAPMFWGIFILGALLPASISAIALIRNGTNLQKMQPLLYTIGVFIFCLLVNQTPIIIKSIINRPV